MLKKFHGWSDLESFGGELWKALPREAVLANITLYWLTGTILSSMRTYYEAEAEQPPDVPTYCDVPTAFARYPAEPWTVPREVMERSYRLVRWAAAWRAFRGTTRSRLVRGGCG